MNNVKFGRVRRTIFITLLLVAFVMAFPVQMGLSHYARKAVLNFKSKLQSEYGIEVTYKSLSPSILANFSVKDVFVSETDGEDLLQIDRIKISYRLIPILKGNYQKGFGNIVIDGIRLDIDQLLNLIQKVSKEVSNADENTDEKAEDKTSETAAGISVQGIQKFMASIPHNVKLKNISLTYANKAMDATFLLREIAIINNERNKNLTFQINCRGRANLIDLNENLSGNLNLSGTIQNELDNSQVSLRLSNLTDGNYSLTQLNLLGTYRNGVFDVRTIQSVIPLFISAEYDMEHNRIQAQLKTEELHPTTILSSSKDKKAFAKLKELVAHTDTSFSCDLSTKELDYSSTGRFDIPNELFQGGVVLNYKVDGDENAVSVSRFSAKGANCSADVNLELVFKTLQLSGLAEIPYFVLPNGNSVSTDIYFDPLDKGFMAFAPQLFLGQKSLTALQLTLLPHNDSYDFAFEAYDYSNTDNGEPGLIKFDGSYLTDSKYVQTSVSLNSLFVSSLVEFGSQVVPAEQINTLNTVAGAADGFMLSGDAYVSTDLKSLSYNVPYILVANTKKDNQVLMLSANGNEQELNLDQLNFVYGKYAFGATAAVNFNKESKDIFFTTDMVFENVPYHFNGTVMNNLVSVSGDYNTLVDLDIDGKKGIFGTITFDNLPLLLSDYSLALSTKTDFIYTKNNGPSVNINQLLVEFDDSKASVVTSPKFILSGNITKYGAQLSSLNYSDLFTTLEGFADFRINFNQNIFDSAGLSVNMKNPLSSEALNIEASFSNPDLIALNGNNFKDSLYITVNAQTNNLGINRFVEVKSDNNHITANVYASGTVSHPYLALNIEDLSMQKGKHIQKIDALLMMEEHNVTVESLNMTKGRTSIKDVKADFNLDDFTGKLKFFYHTAYAHKEIDAPIEVEIKDSVKAAENFMPQSFVATLKSDGVTGNHFKKNVPLDFTVLYTQDAVTVMSGPKLGLFVNYLKSGDITINVDSPDIMKINGMGTIAKEGNYIDIYNIDVNVAKVFEFINYDNWVIVENGQAKGSATLTGTWSDPKLNGLVNVYEPAARVPIAVPVKLQAEMTPITIVDNDIYVNKNTYSVKNKPCLDADCRIVLKGFGFDYLECFFKSVNNEKIHGHLDIPLFSVDTDMLVDLWLYYGGDDALFEIDGSIIGENVNFISPISSLTSVGGEPPENPLNFVSTLNITTGTHASISFDPLIRTVIAPKSKFNITCDNKARYYHIDGNVDVKSGDIAYVSRNFYIKSGNINFNTERLSNPKITLQAETREKDDKGNTVKIILNVTNQYLLSLNPRFSSIPAKSETEILSILGQIALGDSDSATDFLFAAGDYALQTSVGRKIENKLRDLFNFDILSLRTNIIQNTLSSTFGSSGALANNFSQSLNFGNLFDNSTVYIGKYLGSDLYVDAMLNVSYDDRKQQEQVSVGNLTFQPEFGLELESPLGNFRWNVAPDINALLNKQFVPSTSLTLSWKFTF